MQSTRLWLTNATTRIRWFTASREEQILYIGAVYSREQWSAGIVNYMRVIGTINVSRTGCITYAPLSTFCGRCGTRSKTQFGSNILSRQVNGHSRANLHHNDASARHAFTIRLEEIRRISSIFPLLSMSPRMIFRCIGACDHFLKNVSAYVSFDCIHLLLCTLLPIII